MCVFLFLFCFSFLPISQPNDYAVSQSYTKFFGFVILKTVLVYAFFSSVFEWKFWSHNDIMPQMN